MEPTEAPGSDETRFQFLMDTYRNTPAGEREIVVQGYCREWIVSETNNFNKDNTIGALTATVQSLQKQLADAVERAGTLMGPEAATAFAEKEKTLVAELAATQADLASRTEQLAARADEIAALRAALDESATAQEERLHEMADELEQKDHQLTGASEAALQQQQQAQEAATAHAAIVHRLQQELLAARQQQQRPA